MIWVWTLYVFYVLQDDLLKVVHSSKRRVAWQFIGFCANAWSAARTYEFGEVDSLLSCNDCRF